MSSCPNIKKRSRDEYISVKSLLKQLENPIPFKEKPKRLKPELDVEEIRSKMKAKWRGTFKTITKIQDIAIFNFSLFPS